MDKTIDIGLSGSDRRFRLNEDAYDRLARYFNRAEARLHDDPDRAEVVADLERSVGDKLGALLGSDDRIVTVTDIEGVLAQIGAVDTGSEPLPGDDAPPRKGRRLVRIREGQSIAGVCNGLAAYSEIRVDWVRTLFVLGTLVTTGLFAIVYVALAFILPVDPDARPYRAERS